MAEQTTVSTKTALWIIGGVIAVVVLIALVTSSGDDDGPALPSIPTTTIAPADDDPAPVGGTGSELDPLNCARLLSNEEAVLALEEDDPDGEIYSAFTVSRGEFCAHEHADDSRNYVLLEPTTAADFADDATRLDAEPERVEGIGQTAVWFGGDEAGSLSVAADSEFGTILYRIEFGRVGISDERRREHAIDLARLVLPRFPGIVLPSPPEPERTEIERPDDPGAVAPTDLLDHVLAGVDDGQWNEAEGFVAALRYLVGDTDGADLVPADGLVDARASNVVAQAVAWAAANDEREQAETIGEILERLFPTPGTTGSFEPIAAPDPEPASGFQLASFMPAPAQEEEEDELQDEPQDELPNQPDDESEGEPLFCPDGVWDDDVICSEVYGPTSAGDSLPAGKYVVHAPKRNELPQGEITESYVDLVREGMTNAALLLHPLGPMPDTIVFITDATHNVEVLHDSRLWGTETCHVFAYESATDLPVEELRQWIAFEMSICFLLRLQPERLDGPAEMDEWQAPAASYYLSAVAEPDGYLESAYIPDFPDTELATPIQKRHRSNIYFFLWLHAQIRAPGVISIIQNSPADGTLDDIAEALAAEPEMADHLQNFSRAAADRGLIDARGREYGEQKVANLTVPAEPGNFVDFDVERLGTDRAIVQVAEGEKACISFETRGDLQTGWKVFDEPGDWTAEPPTEIEGEWVLVATTVKDGAGYVLSVDDVVDSGDSCDDESDSGAPEPIDVEPCAEGCGSSDYANPNLDVLDLSG